MGTISIKQGASLSLALAFSNTDGSATSLTGATITAQVRDSSDLMIAALTASVGSSAGQATLAASDTSSWPIGTGRCDIKMTQAGLISFSDTFNIDVQRAVTHP
jgi:hypothetical protein